MRLASLLVALLPAAFSLAACAAHAPGSDAAADGGRDVARDAPDPADGDPGDASDDAPAPGLGFGEPCTHDEECSSHLCITGPGLGAGCGAPCTRDADCAAIDPTYSCALDRPTGGSPRFTCAVTDRGTVAPSDPCTSDGECLSNLCVDSTCRGPCADDTGCGAGLRCGDLSLPSGGGTVRACRVAPITGPTVEDYVMFEGTVMTDTASPVYPVIVPPDVVSLTFTVQDLEGSDLFVSVANLQAPDRSLWINSRTWNGIAEQPVRVLIVDHQINSALAPSSDTLRLLAGRYLVNFAVVNPQGATTRVAMRRVRYTARIKRAPGGTFTSGTLHLRMYIVGSPGGMTAATAPSNARLQNALARMTSILGGVGVHVVVDGYSDIAGADGSRLTVIDSRDELGQLFSLTAGVSAGDQLNLFIIRGVASGAGLENAIGVSGAIDGPAGIHGTINSGVVAAWDTTIGGGVDLLPQTITHECGHYLGLWHTRESAAPCTMPGQMGCAPFGGVDPITDTPTDDATSSTYLMNWSTSNGSNVRVSAGEGRVLRAHALVH